MNLLLKIIPIFLMTYGLSSCTPSHDIKLKEEVLIQESDFIIGKRGRNNLVPDQHSFYSIINDSLLARITYQGEFLHVFNLRTLNLDSIGVKALSLVEKKNYKRAEPNPNLRNLTYHGDYFAGIQFDNDTLKALVELQVGCEIDEKLTMINSVSITLSFDSLLNPIDTAYFASYTEINGFFRYSTSRDIAALINGIPLYPIRTTQETIHENSGKILLAYSPAENRRTKLYSSINTSNHLINGFSKKYFDGYLFVNQSESGSYYATEGHCLYLYEAEQDSFIQLTKLIDDAREVALSFSVLEDEFVAYHVEKVERDNTFTHRVIIKSLKNGQKVLERDFPAYYSRLGMYNNNIIALRMNEEKDDIYLVRYEVSVD